MPDWMSEPTIISRANHTRVAVCHRPDALKVLQPAAAGRLRRVPGGRQRARPAARPAAEGLRHRHVGASASRSKRLFRNCWIIGRRFRLAHVKFGTKTIEVATFRRQLSEQELAEQEVPSRATPPSSAAGRRAGRPRSAARCIRATTRSARRKRTPSAATSRSTRSSTTSATFSIIDYVGGLEDLHARVIRSHRRSGRAVPGGSGAHAARGGAGRAARLHDRSGRGAMPITAPRVADRRGVAGRGCSRSSTRSCGLGASEARFASARRGRPARAPRARS